MADNCIFCKIAAREIPSDVVVETEKVLVFRDIHPEAPVHYLAIPKEHIESLNGVDATNAAVVGEILQAVAQAAGVLGVSETGYRVIANTNRDAGQEVFHLHFHILGGKRLGRMVSA